jgi:hypothetical protein
VPATSQPTSDNNAGIPALTRWLQRLGPSLLWGRSLSCRGQVRCLTRTATRPADVGHFRSQNTRQGGGVAGCPARVEGPWTPGVRGCIA